MPKQHAAFKPNIWARYRLKARRYPLHSFHPKQMPGWVGLAQLGYGGNQLWQFFPASDGTYYIVDANEGKFCDIQWRGFVSVIKLEPYMGINQPDYDKHQKMRLLPGKGGKVFFETYGATAVRPEVWSVEWLPKQPAPRSEIYRWGKADWHPRRGGTQEFLPEIVDVRDPGLKKGTHEPFNIGPLPKIDFDNVPEQGEEVLIGQTPIPFYLVTDVDGRFRDPKIQIREAPWYVLTRTQRYRLVDKFRHEGPAREETIRYFSGVKKEESQVFEATTNLSFAAKLSLLIKTVTIPLEFGLKQSLKVTTTRTRSEVSEEERTTKIRYEEAPPGKPVMYATYIIDDIYTLRRYTSDLNAAKVRSWVVVPDRRIFTTAYNGQTHAEISPTHEE
ncbi:MAG: hypothetical protein AAF841_08960 [Pseudomonadota bacterium]